MNRLLLYLLIVTMISCTKDEKEENNYYVKFGFKDKQINIVGIITFNADDIAYYDKKIKYTYKCGVNQTNYPDGEDDIAEILLSIPAYSNYVNDTLIGRKYPIIKFNCGSSDGIDMPFYFSLNLRLNNVSYNIVPASNNSRFYNKITKINHLGHFNNYQTQELYEVEGEFKVCLVNQNVTPFDSIFINDGIYRVRMVSFNESYK